MATLKSPTDEYLHLGKLSQPFCAFLHKTISFYRSLLVKDLEIYVWGLVFIQSADKLNMDPTDVFYLSDVEVHKASFSMMPQDMHQPLLQASLVIIRKRNSEELKCILTIHITSAEMIWKLIVWKFAMFLCIFDNPNSHRVFSTQIWRYILL